MLAPIMMSIEMLQMQCPGEEAAEILHTLQGSTQRAADLVRQVLTFARGVEGRRVEIRIDSLLEEVRRVIRETFPRNIELQIHCAPQLWSVTGDPTQMHQVLINLCVNARDAMPTGGTLHIAATNIVLDALYAAANPDARQGPHVLIEVLDSGTGMTPAERERIFEPFFTTREVGKGTGLGLSTALAIVRSHGGFVDVYSEPGRGSSFKIYLPADTTPRSAEPPPAAQPLLPHGHGECVLVVDDEEGIRIVARKTLERYGYQVLLAANGAEAVDLYSRHREQIAVVITDMAMPVMDGPATILALKAINPGVRIIASSGLTSRQGVVQSVAADVKHFIPKPYTADRMLRALEEILKENPGPAPAAE
jgi:CheY-like chemotaxis protein